MTKNDDYVGKRSKGGNLGKQTENFKINQTASKILAIMLGILGLNGLFIVYFGVTYGFASSMGGTAVSNGGENYAISIIIIVFGLAICLYFLRLALKLVSAIEFNARIKIRSISLTSFLSSVAFIIYELFLRKAEVYSYEGGLVLFAAFLGIASVTSYYFNRTLPSDRYWESQTDKADKTPVKTNVFENPFRDKE